MRMQRSAFGRAGHHAQCRPHFALPQMRATIQASDTYCLALTNGARLFATTSIAHDGFTLSGECCLP